MSKQKTDYMLFGVSVLSFLMLAVSFLLMPIESENTQDKISATALVAGVMFWVSIVIGVATQVVLSARRKKWYSENRIKTDKKEQKIGLISFFKNIYSIIADIASAISLIGLVVAMIVTHSTGYICYVFVSAFIFSFSMHCILNGKVFYFVTNQNKLLYLKEYVKRSEIKGKEEKSNG